MHYAKTKRRRKIHSTEAAAGRVASNDPVHRDTVQGEGNYDAAREFNAAEHEFVQSGKVEAAARAAAPKDDAEKQQLEEAEEQARNRAKEDYPPPPDAPPRRTDAARNEPSKDAPRRRR